ncbi:hypothetical protein MKL11_22265 [Methylobacterium sp. J-077]|nr:hypothetical protein [Methylobacterium sp. J-077]
MAAKLISSKLLPNLRKDIPIIASINYQASAARGFVAGSGTADICPSETLGRAMRGGRWPISLKNSFSAEIGAWAG